MPTPIAATQVGTAHIQGVRKDVTAMGAIGFTNPDGTGLAGYISPNIQKAAIKPSANNVKIRGQDGYTSGIIGTDDMLECVFDFIPEGTTKTNALGSAQFPKNLARGAVTGFPVIAMGPFADAFNTDGASNQPWIYESDANLNAGLDNWDGTVTLRRYVAITSGAAIS